jgi:hypothetical protein
MNFFEKNKIKNIHMNNHRQHPWFGLDDLGSADILNATDPKPLYNEKSQHEQDKALQNPEESIDKDPGKPWVQGEEKAGKTGQNSGVNSGALAENGDPPIDEWAEPATKDNKPRPR